MSVQSERNSFSDVDSPVSHNVENVSSKPEQLTEVPSANVESTSPLLSSLLKSPTSSLGLIASNSTNPVAPVVPTVVENDKTTVEEKVEVEEKMEIDNEIQNGTGTATVEVEETEKEPIAEKEVDEFDKSEENIEEILAAAADQVNEMLPDLMSILTEAETEEENKEIESVDNEVKEAEQNGISCEETNAETEKINQNHENENENQEQPLLNEASIKEEIEEKPISTTTAPSEATLNDTVSTDDVVKIEDSVPEIINEVTNGQVEEAEEDEIKIENDVAVDEKAMLDEDKPLTSSSESKRQTRTSQSSKSGRRPRKQSDILPEDDGNEDTPRRETRSKKNSERSDDVSGGLEAASEESPLPPPLTPHGTRETRRSAAKKAQVVVPATSSETSNVGDDLESSKEEKEDVTTPQSVAENRRISRLKEKEVSGLTLFYTFKFFKTVNYVFLEIVLKKLCLFKFF